MIPALHSNKLSSINVTHVLTAGHLIKMLLHPVTLPQGFDYVCAPRKN